MLIKVILTVYITSHLGGDLVSLTTFERTILYPMLYLVLVENVTTGIS